MWRVNKVLMELTSFGLLEEVLFTFSSSTTRWRPYKVKMGAFKSVINYSEFMVAKKKLSVTRYFFAFIVSIFFLRRVSRLALTRSTKIIQSEFEWWYHDN